MGWWGHGIMDGDGPSDAAYLIKVDALGREAANAYDDKNFVGALTVEDEEALRAAVHKKLDKICANVLRRAKEVWKWGGPADLIAAVYTLHRDYGVEAIPKSMKDKLKDAFEVERAEASMFDTPSARRNALTMAAKELSKLKTKR